MLSYVTSRPKGPESKPSYLSRDQVYGREGNLAKMELGNEECGAPTTVAKAASLETHSCSL